MWHIYVTLYLVREFIWILQVSTTSNFAPPADAKQLKKFLDYYWKCIQSYANIAEPLNNLLHRNSPGFLWNAQCQIAFDTLSLKLTIPPTIVCPDFKMPFIMSTDVRIKYSHWGYPQPRTKRVLADYNDQLQKVEHNYSTMEWETLQQLSSPSNSFIHTCMVFLNRTQSFYFS